MSPFELQTVTPRPQHVVRRRGAGGGSCFDENHCGYTTRSLDLPRADPFIHYVVCKCVFNRIPVQMVLPVGFFAVALELLVQAVRRPPCSKETGPQHASCGPYVRPRQ